MQMMETGRRAFTGLCAALLGLVAASCASLPSSGGGAGERHVTVATADGNADALLFLEPREQGAAQVGAFAHRGLFARKKHVAQFEIGEFVLRRKLRMGFRRPLVLRDLRHRLPSGTQAGVFGGEGVAVAVTVGEHQAVGQVRIMRHAYEIRAGPGRSLFEEGPQVFRAIGNVIAEGQEAARRFAIDIGHHHAVKVPRIGSRAPFPADHGGEGSRNVVAFGGGDLFVPACLPDRVCRQLGEIGRSFRFGNGKAHDGRGHRLPALARQQVAPLLAERGREHLRVTAFDPGVDAEIFGMVGHDDEVERIVDLDALPGLGEHDRDPARKAIGRIDIGAGQARGKGIDRIARMDMGIAPQEDAIAIGRCRRSLRLGHMGIDRLAWRVACLPAGGQRYRGSQRQEEAPAHGV